jgi:acetyl esterase
MLESNSKGAGAMTTSYEIHPDMRELVAAKEVLTRTTDAEVLKREWDNYGAKLSRPYPAGMVVKDETFSCPGAGSDGEVKVRIYRPAAATVDAPCVIFVHGGGFIKGSLDSGDSNAWGISEETAAVVISVDYRLAPEFPYPAALTDVYGVLRYIAENSEALGVDKDRIAVWGESAGGNLSAAVSLMARDKGGPKIAAQVLVYPALADDFTAPSYTIHANSVGLTTASCISSREAYRADGAVDKDHYAAPLTNDNLRNLPPAFIHYAEIDPLADDSPRYAEKLTAARVPTTLRCAKGMIHGFIRARFTGTTAANEFSLPCMFLRGVFASSGIARGA